MIDLSIIIPAYNEEKYIGKTLSSLEENIKLLSEKINIEVIVVDNNSSDNTKDIVSKFKVKLFFLKERGISKARNFGASKALGRYLLFLDADTIFNYNTVLLGVYYLKKNHIFVGTNVKFDNQINLAAAFVLNMWNLISTTFLLMAGSFMMVKKKNWKKINGLDENLFISEELNFSNRLKKYAKKNKLKTGIILNGFPVITSDRKLRDYGFFETLKLLFPLIINFKKKSKDIKNCDYWYVRKK